MTNLVLFDIDGTLINARGAGSQALHKTILSCHGVNVPIQDMKLDGKTDPLIVHEALRLAGENHSPEGILTKTFLNTYEGYLGKELENCPHYRVLPGVVDLLDCLCQENDFLVGLATGNVFIGAHLKLDKGHLMHYFCFGGYGCDNKSRTKIVLQAIKRGRDILDNQFSGRVIVIGDTPHDIQHGHAAGVRTVGVCSGNFNLKQLRTCKPDALFESLVKTKEIVQALRTI